jgi:DDE superfamily endonuclease
MFSPSASSGARLAWREMQKGLDPKKLVLIGETWASTNMTPRYGRCEMGQRLLAYTPFGHWKTTTFVAALRHDGTTAPCVFDGPINGAKFLAYVEQVLAPTLSPGETVVMDNSPLASPTIMPVGASSQRRSAPIKSQVFAKPSKPPGRRSAFCPPTVLTSIPSNKSSPTLRRRFHQAALAGT